MSSHIKSLALLIAIVGLAVASNASLVNGESSDNIPNSLSELGDFDSLDWVRVLRSECKTDNCEPDKAFELLKKLDKIYGALDDNAKINRNEQKIVEQFEINQIDGDQFCSQMSLMSLMELSSCYKSEFKHDLTISDKRKAVRDYLHERERNLAFVCRTHVLKNLDKRVADLDETDRRDMEQKLANKLVLLKESNEKLVGYSKRPKTSGTKWEGIETISPKWMDILLEFMKEKSGNDLDAKNYITILDEEGKEKFNRIFHTSVIDKCWRWRDAVIEAATFRQRDARQTEDCTVKQASWIKYVDVCHDITVNQELLAKSLYSKFNSDLFKLTVKLAKDSRPKKVSHSGAKLHNGYLQNFV